MFLTLSLPAKRPRPMIGKGITKGTKKQSTLIYSGDVTRVKYVSHLKCADGQVAIRRTIRLGDSANSFLERERESLSVFYVRYELRWRHPQSAHLPQHFRKVGSSRTASEILLATYHAQVQRPLARDTSVSRKKCCSSLNWTAQSSMSLCVPVDLAVCQCRCCIIMS